MLDQIMLAMNGPLWLEVVIYLIGQWSWFVGVVNLLPGLPLDGGRILRVLLWYLDRTAERAARDARHVGLLITYGLIIGGALGFSGNLLAGNALLALRDGTLILVGCLLHEAGSTARRRAAIAQALASLQAQDVMRQPSRAIAPTTTLRQLAALIRQRSGRQPTAVLESEQLVGMIDREQLLAVPQGYWDTRTVAEAMTPANALDPVTPTTKLTMVIPRLVSREEGELWPLVVVEDERLVGMIDAVELCALLDLEEEFGLFSRRVVPNSATANTTDWTQRTTPHTARQQPQL